MTRLNLNIMGFPTKIQLIKRTQCDSVYLKIQSIVDFVSGMTDVFALDLYRKIKGISLPGVV
jgi:dGTP triphosphohydrolase